VTASQPLLVEPGARWRPLVWGPALCLAGGVLEAVRGLPVHVLGWVGAAVLLTAVTSLQVLGARRHSTVELTTNHLRQGAEVLELASVAEVLAADPDGRASWQMARALGETPTVPRRRTGIGLRLRDGRTVQAWARDDEALRAALVATVPGPRT
jgi:hypothetical protein